VTRHAAHGRLGGRSTGSVVLLSRCGSETLLLSLNNLSAMTDTALPNIMNVDRQYVQEYRDMAIRPKLPICWIAILAIWIGTPLIT